MFHFTRPSGYATGNHRQGYPTGYPPRSSFDADYMVAQEEAAIRQRLADIETQRQQTYYNPGLQYSYEDSTVPSYGHQESRLAALRREVELEEQRYAAVARRQEEQALEAKLHATRQRRQALENASAPRPRAPPAVEFVVAEPQSLAHGVSPRSAGPSMERHNCSRAHHRGVTRVQETLSSEPLFLNLLSSLVGGNLRQHNNELTFHDVLSQVLQPALSSATKPRHPQPTEKTHPSAAASTATEPPFLDLISSLMGGNSQPPNAQEQVGTAFHDILSQMLQPGVSSAPNPTPQPTRQNHSLPNASTSASSTEPLFLGLLSSLMGGIPQQASEQSKAGLQDIFSQIVQSGLLSGGSQTKQGTSTQKQPEAESLEDFFGHIMKLGSQFSGQAQPPTQAGSSSSVPSTLKDELESRLYRDDSVESKDLLEAIKASLQDAPAPAATSTTPTSATVDSSSTSDAGKGKGKAEPTPVSPTVAATALDTIRNIEAAYTTLESDFSFPSTLDFADSPSASRSNSPNSSDSETSSSSRLAYTSRNQPVRYFEQSLTGLITQLDEIETLGNDELRSKRKDLVDRIEKTMEELDSEIDGRWKSKARKEEKDLKAREEKEKEEKEVAAALEASIREAEVQSAYGSEASLAASEATVRPYDVDSAPEPTSTPTSTSTTDATPATPSSETLDTFLLPANADNTTNAEVKKSEKKDSDSDWSEVEA